MNATQCFLERLFAPYAEESGLFMELRPLYPTWMQSNLYPEGGAADYWRLVKERRVFYPWPAREAMARDALRFASVYDMYLGVLPRASNTSGKAENLRLAWWLWCDIDACDSPGGEVWELLGRADIPMPHLLVSSGSGGLHCYWRLSAPVELSEESARERFRQTLLRLVEAISPGLAFPSPAQRKAAASPAARESVAHADPGCAFPSATLRIAGTWNLKRKDAPHPVMLEEMPGEEEEAHSYDWWRAHLPPEPSQPERRPRPRRAPGEIPARLMQLVNTSSPPGTGHRHRLKIATWAACEGISEAGILDLLEYNDTLRAASTSESELKVLARTSVRKFSHRIGTAL